MHGLFPWMQSVVQFGQRGDPMSLSEVKAPAGHESMAMVETVRSILKTKGNNVWSLSPDATVYDAIALMAEKGDRKSVV